MKHFSLISVLLAVGLLLSACASSVQPADAPTVSQPDISEPAPENAVPPETAAPSETAAPAETAASSETEAPSESAAQAPASDAGESSAFTAAFSGLDASIVGVIYNEPFNDGAPRVTAQWNNVPWERLAIVPRYAGTVVSAYGVNLTDAGELAVERTPVYSTVAADGCIIGAGLTRPDAMPAWYVEMLLPDGQRAGLMLYYNGRYGTPRYEFLTLPTDTADYAPQLDAFGEPLTAAYLRAAKRQGLTPADAAKRCFSQWNEFGDGAAFTLSEGEMDGAYYHLDAARFHIAYYQEMASLAASVRAQDQRYQSIGNRDGILGPGRPSSGEALYFQLTGLTVYNPTMLATKVRITVNDRDLGEFDLNPSDACTLLEFADAEKLNTAVSVDVQVVETRRGTPEEAILEVYPGIASNISGAI